MNENESRMNVRHRALRAAGLLLAGATVLKVWWAPAPWESLAAAQIPDSGLQRKQLIDEARQTNVLLSDIRRILGEGRINVRLEGADNQSNAAPSSRSGKSAGDK